MKTCIRRSTVLLTSVALALAASVSAPAPTLSLASARPTSHAFADPEGRIDGLGRKEYRSIYGGMTAPDNGAEFDVYLTKRDPKVEAAFRAVAPSTKIVFKLTPNTIRTLISMMNTLTGKWQSLRTDGIVVDAWGPNIQLGRLDIGVIDLTASDTRHFDNLFGAGNINIYNVAQEQANSIVLQVASADRIASSNRATDPAHNGGSRAVLW